MNKKIITIIFIMMISCTVYAQERFDKVDIYMNYGSISIFPPECGFDEDFTRVNAPVFFSTKEKNFLYELKNIIDSLPQIPNADINSREFFPYVVIDFIKYSRMYSTISLDEYGNFRFEKRGQIYKKQDALVKLLYDHFGYFLNPYHRLYERMDEK